MRKRVFRVLVYEGDEEWINNTLNGSWVQDKVEMPKASITSQVFLENDVILDKQVEEVMDEEDRN